MQQRARRASESPGAIIRAGGIPAAVAHFDRIAAAALDPAPRAQPRPLTPVAAMLLGTMPDPVAAKSSSPAACPEPAFGATGSPELLPDCAAGKDVGSVLDIGGSGAVLSEAGSPARSAACAVATAEETVESTPLTAGNRRGIAGAPALEGMLKWNCECESARSVCVCCEELVMSMLLHMA